MAAAVAGQMSDKLAEADADSEARKEETARRVSYGLGLMMLAVTMVVPTRAPMVLQIKKGDAAATARAMGLMSMCAAMIELVVNPVLGKLSDEYGRKPFLMLAPVVNAFLHSLVAMSPSSLAMQFLDRMISGMFIFGFNAPANAALADLYASNPKQLGEATARMNMYFGIGCAVGPFIGAKMGGAKSFLASALAFLATLCYVRSQVRETLPEDSRKKFKLADINPVAFLKLFKTTTMGWLTATVSLQSFGDYVNIYDINNLFMIKVLGYQQGQIGNFATAVGVSQIAGGGFTKELIKRTSLKTSTAFSNAMWVVGMAMMGSARNTTQAFCALFMWTFGHMRSSSVQPYLQKYGAQQQMGRAEILGAQGNMLAYVKVMIPLLYSNVFAWATSNGRNMPGLPYFVICVLTVLAQGAFLKASPED